jgi:hypothetical protein
MATAYINKNILLPRVTAQRLDHNIFSDEGYTIGTNYRRDTLGARKRIWRLTLSYNTSTQYAAILSHLDSIDWASTFFWLDEFGGTAAANSIAAFFTIENDDRTQFQSASWENKGRNLVFIVREA